MRRPFYEIRRAHKPQTQMSPSILGMWFNPHSSLKRNKYLMIVKRVQTYWMIIHAALRLTSRDAAVDLLRQRRQRQIPDKMGWGGIEKGTYRKLIGILSTSGQCSNITPSLQNDGEYDKRGQRAKGTSTSGRAFSIMARCIRRSKHMSEMVESNFNHSESCHWA